MQFQGIEKDKHAVDRFSFTKWQENVLKVLHIFRNYTVRAPSTHLFSNKKMKNNILNDFESVFHGELFQIEAIFVIF